MDERLRERLQEISRGEVVFDCPLARYSSFAIGGPADALLVVKKRDDLVPLLMFLQGESLAWRVVGKGSNLLIRDVGYRGLVIILRGEFAGIHGTKKIGADKISLCVGAGCSITKLNHYCSSHGFGGLEFSYGIPGTVGGALLMNAGAWGKEMAEVVTDVGIITETGYVKLTGHQLDFTYRKWPGFSQYIGRGVIVDVTVALFIADTKVLEQQIKELLKKRKATQPHNSPSGGSVFKNPQGDNAGRLIDACGLKGESVGGAMVSEKHANVIINKEKATAEDVLTLIKRIQLLVKKRFHVDLELELHVL